MQVALTDFFTYALKVLFSDDTEMPMHTTSIPESTSLYQET